MKAIFLDRDDTIVVDTPDYCIDDVSKIQFMPDTVSALQELAKLNYGLFIVTNQEGISTGRITENKFYEIHNEILNQLKESGVHIIKTYMCPHSENDMCDCRKPKPGLLLRAAHEFGIDLADAWFIGDRQTDVQAGLAAGTRTILVKTSQTPQDTANATHVAANLTEAVRYITA